MPQDGRSVSETPGWLSSYRPLDLGRDPALIFQALAARRSLLQGRPLAEQVTGLEPVATSVRAIAVPGQPPGTPGDDGGGKAARRRVDGPDSLAEGWRLPGRARIPRTDGPNCQGPVPVHRRSQLQRQESYPSPVVVTGPADNPRWGELLDQHWPRIYRFLRDCRRIEYRFRNLAAVDMLKGIWAMPYHLSDTSTALAFHPALEEIDHPSLL